MKPAPLPRGYAAEILPQIESCIISPRSYPPGDKGHMQFVACMLSWERMLRRIEGYTEGTATGAGAAVVPNYHLYSNNSHAVRSMVLDAIKPVVVQWLKVQIKRDEDAGIMEEPLPISGESQCRISTASH